MSDWLCSLPSFPAVLLPPGEAVVSRQPHGDPLMWITETGERPQPKGYLQLLSLRMPDAVCMKCVCVRLTFDKVSHKKNSVLFDDKNKCCFTKTCLVLWAMKTALCVYGLSIWSSH